MKVLALNCGSSTLKFHVFETDPQGSTPGQERRLAGGIVDRIGGHAAMEFSPEGGQVVQEAAPVANHEQATRRVLEWLDHIRFTGPQRIDAVGHRVVHGGDRFVEPTLIDDEVVAAIEEVGELAPLHNGPALSAIRAARVALGTDIPMVATFDTAFHREMPERASRYAIPADLAERHRIQRYGFHGLAHRYMAERYAEITSARLERTKLITLQLGAGCSATAVEDGRANIAHGGSVSRQ